MNVGSMNTRRIRIWTSQKFGVGKESVPSAMANITCTRNVQVDREER
jgi:hypothetical protein